MAAVRGRNTRLLVNQWDFSGVSNSLEVALTVDRADSTVFTSTAAETVPLMTSGTITQNGYLDDVVAGSFEASMQNALANTSALYVGALFGTNVAACPAYVARATNIDGLTIASPADGLMTVQGEWTQGGGILRGLRIFSGTRTATGVTSPVVDLSAAGSAGGYAWLFVQAIDGTATNATISVITSQVSNDWNAPTGEGTFTFSAVGGYEIALNTSIYRYMRLNVTSLGGATGFTIVCIAAVRGVTY
jgi:hypothetical protein